AAVDGEVEQRLRRGELRRVRLDVVVFEIGLVQRQARQVLLVRIRRAEAGLPVALEAEVRVEVAAAGDERLELMLLGHPIPPRAAAGVGPHDEEREEVRADEREGREEHEAAQDDLLVEVAGDLERVRRARDRRDVVRGRLLDRVASAVVLADELAALDGLLLGLDLVLVADEEGEESDQADEQGEAERGQQHVDVERHALISSTDGSHSFFVRSMTFSGLVSTTSVPFCSMMWKSWSGFGAGPPSTTAVFLL